jgi:hypothetical protein
MDDRGIRMNPATLFRAGCENYYIIIGSSAGALIGLQFIVMALIADRERPGGPAEVDAFGTPTILHFVAALILSLIASTPWPSFEMMRAAIGLFGALGLLYVGIVIRRMGRQTGYQLVTEDRLWYGVIPFIAYALLIGAAVLMRVRPQTALFTTAGATLLLLCIGIRNAWDTITYIAIDMRPPSPPKE